MEKEIKDPTKKAQFFALKLIRERIQCENTPIYDIIAEVCKQDIHKVIDGSTTFKTGAMKIFLDNLSKDSRFHEEVRSTNVLQVKKK